MPDISEFLDKPDPTLEAVDAAICAEQTPRTSKNIGFGVIGHPCRLKIFNDINSTEPEIFSAETLRIFNNGHSDEAIMASYLRKVKDIELHTHDPDRGGKQYKLDNLDGRLTGRLDGAIKGLKQAPVKWHPWEHKSVNEKKFDKFEKLKKQYGEKNVLKIWDEIYFSQAQMNMYHMGLDRHYLTVSTPGVRKYSSARTELDKGYAEALIRKADYIINAEIPPEKISNNPDDFICRFCRWKDLCHG